MRLRRIRLKNYRGTVEREIRFPERGVTIIAGPNEAGKTSLAEAVDLSLDFLDSSTHRRVKAVKPVHADAGAEVELDVESGPYAFTLFKRFHRNKSTTLEVRRPKRESWTGREAHERVQQILAESVDLPLWRALRMQQGTELELPDLAGHASLAAALDRAAGEARSGPAETSLFDVVEKEFRVYFTPTGQEGRELKAAAHEVASERETCATLTRELHRAEDLVASSARLDEEMLEYRETVVRLEQNVARHTARRDAIRKLRRELTALAQAAETSAAHARNAEAQVTEREALTRQVADLRGQREELEARAHPQDDAQRRVQEDTSAAAQELAAARDAFARAEALARVRRADLDRRRAELDHAQLSERRARIEQAEADASRAAALLEENHVDAACLARIRAAHLAVERARAAAASGTPHVRIEAARPLEVELDGETRGLETGQSAERSVHEPLRLVVPDVLRIDVRPSTEAATHVENLRSAEQRLASLLAESGVESLEDADRRRAARGEAQRRLDARDTVVRENLRDLQKDDLQRKVERLAARIDAFARQRADEPPLPADFDAAQDAEAAARAAHTAARERLERAERGHAKVQERLQAHERETRDAAAQLRVIASQHDVLESRLREERARRSDEQLRSEATARRARAVADERTADEKREQLTSAGDEDIDELCSHAEKARAGAHAEVRRAEDERLRIGARLEELGERGLEEELGAARARLVRAERAHAALRRRADAARLLYTTMSARRDEARRAYVAPLRERIERLGRNVFGSSFTVELDEDLRVVRRTLRGRTVPFEGLSAGAREQISLLTRVACAMTVAQDGGVPLVLDDALGYTDRERLAGIGAVLSLAGRQGQVIVLTCVPERYAAVGESRVVRLGDDGAANAQPAGADIVS